MKELRPESDKALKIIADFWAKEDPKWVVTRDNVYRYLIEHEEVATGDIEEHRHWYIQQVIFKVGNHYIPLISPLSKAGGILIPTVWLRYFLSKDGSLSI